MVAEETVPIDARVIKLNSTPDYCLKHGDKQFIKRIWDVWVYDKNQHTHCCELTPSYSLIHLYTEVELSDKGSALPDAKKDEIYERYEHEPTDDKYVHVSDIDRLEEILLKKPFRYYVYGNPGVSFDDVDRDQQMESLREHFNANHPL